MKHPGNYSQLLTKLQDALGTMNDVATVRRLLEELPSCENDSRVDQATGIILGWGGYRAMVKKRELDRVWESFYKTDPFWQKSAARRDMLS